MKKLEQFLAESLGIGGWHLLVAEPVFEVLGGFDAQTQQAFKEAFMEVAGRRKFPPEIVAQGMRATGIFLNAFGYDYLREVLLETANQVKKG